ncbi:hypothetical protein AMECASPLE_020359 [Ameca splendens]|uniref:Uncharacterized protein n=1 Tax=Ameca splendens TaxID=208324 RepID=A0ABV0XG96_9TELE
MGVALVYLSILTSLVVYHDKTVYLNLILECLLFFLSHFVKEFTLHHLMKTPQNPLLDQLSLVSVSFSVELLVYSSFSSLTAVSVISSYTGSVPRLIQRESGIRGDLCTATICCDL